MCKYCEKIEPVVIGDNMVLKIFHNRMKILEKIENLVIADGLEFNGGNPVLFNVVCETRIKYCPYCGEELPEENVKLGEKKKLWQ